MAESQPSIEERISAAIAPPEPPQEAPPEPVAEAPLEVPTELAPEVTETAETEPDPTTTDPLVPVDEPVDEPGEEVTLSSLTELAEHVGVDVGDLYNLAIPVTDADGNRAEVSLSEWKDSYQHTQRAEKAAREAAELRETLQAEQTKLAEQFERQAQENAHYLNAADQQLMAEFQKVNWDQLRVENPTEWTAKRQEMGERQQRLQAIRQEAARKYDQTRQEIAQKQQQEFAQLVEREQAAMLSAIPDWKNDAKRTGEQAKVREYLSETMGYTQQQLDQAYDHRAIVMARKAMLYDQMLKAGSAAKKKVVKIGSKVLKPGAKQSKAAAKHDAESALRNRLRKTGHVDDAAALIQQRLGR